MRIVRVESWRSAVPLSRPYTISQVTTSAVDLQFVRIVSSGRHVGLGSANAATRVTGETADECEAALKNQAKSLLEGQDPRRLPFLLRELEHRLPDQPGARAALDMALHDLAARELELPVTELFGRRHESLPTSITIGILPVDQTLAEAKEYLGRGFRHLKVKIGRSLEEDLERLTRLREVHGDSIQIRVDANEGYSFEETKKALAATEGLRLEFLEQPMPRADIAALEQLPREQLQKIALDESVHDDRDALALLRRPLTPGLFVIKLMKCGGLGPALRVARLAELSGIRLMWGCMDESLLGITAALHAALACQATRYLDLDGSFDLAADPATGGFLLENGRLSLPDRPGLGVRLE
ncbi:MAG: dipeptide epimerase [Planctomycetota bacterium]